MSEQSRDIIRESEVDHYVDAERTLLTVIPPHTLHANQHMLCRQHNHYRMYSWSSATERCLVMPSISITLPLNVSCLQMR